ncbi:MAG: hypothetical protein GY810_05685 [Aureispira sp.]|nr:hypothetical protein [Aureispira sp.]
MNLFRFIKLMIQHHRLVIAMPILLAILVYYQTMDEKKIYSSFTTIYTGIASGYDIDMSQGIGDRFMIQSVFENILTIMKSKETKEEVALKLLTQHLLQDSANYDVLSPESISELNNLLSEDIRKELIVSKNYDKTYENVYNYMKKDHSNKIYTIIHIKPNTHYSLRTLSDLAFKRVKSSDIIKISFQSTDPGICINTLRFFSEAFIKKYRDVKVSETSDIVKYFEEQLQKAQKKLDGLEAQLLSYRSANNILDYTEQARAIAQRRQEMEGMIYSEKMTLSSAQKTATYAEEQLNIHFKVLAKNSEILAKRHQLEQLASQLAMYRTFTTNDKDSIQTLETNLSKLRTDMEKDLSDVFAINYTTSGVKSKEILQKWFENIIAIGESKARLDIYDQRSENFKQLYSTMAPVGSNLTKIEREVGVAESEYLRILEALNLAKLRQQNIALSTRLKIVDNPKFPKSPDPSKRKLLIIIAFLLGLALIIAILVILEFLDQSIRQPKKLIKLTKLELASAFPLFPKKESKHIHYEQLKTMLSLKLSNCITKHTPPKNNLKIGIISMYPSEGKSFIINELNNLFQQKNKSVNLFIPQPKDGSATTTEGNIQYYDPNLIELGAVEIFKLDKQPSEQNITLVEYPYWHSHLTPSNLLQNMDLCILVVQANRSWKYADRIALQDLKSTLSAPPYTFLNGVKLGFMEEVVGQLPRTRSKLRLYLRRILHLEFK